MHLAIDPAMNVHGIPIIDTEVSDSEGMGLVMPVQTPILPRRLRTAPTTVSSTYSFGRPVFAKKA